MRSHGVLPGLVLSIMGALLGACGGDGDDGQLVHRMNVVIGADVRTIEAGQLNASLYAYDPGIADKAPDTLDTQRVPFSHAQGTATPTAVTLRGRVPEGFETFVGVEGYERRGDVLNRVLWDGQEGTGMPTRVEMQELTEEVPPPEADRLAESLADWQVLKGHNGGHYQYDVGFASWVGFSDTTTLEVRDDEVVLRRYEARDAEGEVTESWTEQGEALGSHEHGAPLQTIEELYAVCRNEVLTRDREENTIYLEFGDDGVLDYCQYVPVDCADDCARGVSIDAFRFLGELEAFAITTDKRAYVATCTDGGFVDCAFTLEASYHNRTDRPVYLHRCYPDGEYPIFGVPTLDESDESAYDPVWACVGHDDQIRVDPGETRTDVLEVRGPNSFDGVTGEPFGVVEGAFQLLYDARPCGGEGNCDSLPEVLSRSAPFEVTVSGPGAGAAGR